MKAMSFKPEVSAVSIQPLSMTQNNNEDRGPEISERLYRPGVLEGNWLEDSVAKISPRMKDEWATLCETSYKPCTTEVLTRPKFEAWEQRICTQGVGARLMIDHHGTNYHHNWTTSNDLSFNILPKGLSGPRIRQFSASNQEWLPAQDYAKIYGNLTKYGLTEFMRRKWAFENKFVRPWRTNYQDDFPQYQNASSIRFFKPKASLNEPDLRHLAIDLLASRQSCPIAFKTPNPQPFRTVLNCNSVSEENGRTE